MEISKKIKAWESRNPLAVWRKSKGLSRNVVAALTGSSINSVIGWEKGGSFPDKDKIEALARVMETDRDTLRKSFIEWSASISR